MADVVVPVRLAGQIRLVAGLRWKIMRNYLRQKSNVLDFIGIVGAGLGAAGLIVAIALAISFGAHSAVRTGHFTWLTFLFLGIIVFWQIFPLFAAGLGVNFEFRTLRRCPRRVSAVYFIHVAYALPDVSDLSAARVL